MRNSYMITIFFAVFIVGCATVKNPYAHIEDNRAKTIVQQSINAYGGYASWNANEYLGFDKWFALYDENGNEEVNTNQVHHYTPTKIYMTWDDMGEKVEQIFTEGEFKKLKAGKLQGALNETSVKNSILAATFVMNVPFNLLDETATLTYDGETTFNGKEVYVLKAEYFPETHQHHTTKDIWWHYVDKETYLISGYKVKHLDHVSLVENDSFIRKGGFVLPGKRSSYRVDENEEKLYLRAAYEYSDYKVGY